MPTYYAARRRDGRTHRATRDEEIAEMLATTRAATLAFVSSGVFLRGLRRADGRSIEATHRALWADRLRYAGIPQGPGRLARGARRCCLGVACDLGVEFGVIDRYDPEGGSLHEYPRVQKWLGLATGDGSYFTTTPRGYVNQRSLVSDNDGGRTFAMIAGIIESEPRGLVAA